MDIITVFTKLIIRFTLTPCSADKVLPSILLILDENKYYAIAVKTKKAQSDNSLIGKSENSCNFFFGSWEGELK